MSPNNSHVDLAGRESEPAILETIRAAVGDPTEERLQAVAAKYRSNPDWHLFGIISRQNLQSIIGVQRIDGDELRIRHIATNKAVRGQGHGRTLIEHVRSALKAEVVWAETDDDALGFYHKCGFKVESLGEQYPGVERYRCTFRR